MTSYESSCAILLFTRSAAEEARKKPLLSEGSHKKNTQIAKALIEQSRSTAISTGMPVLLWDSQKQRGNTFGQRLANAVEDTWALGYEKVIVIGNDSPGLSTELLLRARLLVESKKLVLGPSLDGGSYLLGLHQEGYDRSSFEQLAWESTALQQSLIHYAQYQEQEIHWLEHLLDIDHAGHLIQLLRTPSFSPFLSLIRSIVASSWEHYSEPPHGRKQMATYSGSLSRRGPPYGLAA